MKASVQRTFGRYRVDFTHLDKIFYPDDGLTKGDVIAYYEGIASRMLPHLKQRVLTMRRFPDGIAKEGFFQKNLPDHFPDWFTHTTVSTADGRQQVPVCNNLASLLYVANQGSLCQHVWLSRTDRPDHPDQMIFDLDPPEDDFASVRRAAEDCIALLDELVLPSYVKTTGSRGLHVCVPLRRREPFDEVRAFARDCARVLVARFPERYTIEQRIGKRGGRLYLDVQRNAFGQTVIAPYSLRALPGAPVATPVSRAALADKSLHARSFTLANLFDQPGRARDPWHDMRRRAHSLGPARDALDRHLADA